MAATKVLVVDDSMVMRTLISGVLERVSGVEVVGTADGADEARELVAELRPDVITLDVEMPGMSGLQFLAELMSTRPIPTIMFSTRTEAGAEDSVEALRLGAIDCFPKPQAASPAEFEKILEKLGKRIKSAKGMELKRRDKGGPDTNVVPIDWNGRPLMIGGDSANTKVLFEMFEHFPENCPPTLVVQHIGPGLVQSMAQKMADHVTPNVVIAEDGMAVEQGTIYLAPQGDAHVIVDGWPDGKIRLLPRDPVAGERPSISVLFASLAKAAPKESVGLLLMRGNEDGTAGLNALLNAGGYAITAADEGEGFTLRRGHAEQPVATDDLASSLLKLCSK